MSQLSVHLTLYSADNQRNKVSDAPCIYVIRSNYICPHYFGASERTVMSDHSFMMKGNAY
jgi:hypothetical protein